jgi:hypothetical protein
MHSSCLFPQFCQTYNTFSAKLYLAGRKPVKWQSIVSLIWLSLRFANVQSMEKAVIYNASLNILIRFYYIHFVAYNIRKLWLSNKHYLTIALIFDDIQTNCNDCVQLRLTYFELIVWICLILLINKYKCTLVFVFRSVFVQAAFILSGLHERLHRRDRIVTVCLSGAACLHADICFSEIALCKSN